MKILVAAIATASIVSTTAVTAGAAGPISIGYATLVALGTSNGYAEYAVRLADDGPPASPIVLLDIDCTAGDGTMTTIDLTPSVVSQVAYSKQFALFLKNPDLRSIKIRYYTGGRGSTSVSSGDDRFDLTQSDLVSPLRFDDTVPWIGALPAAFAFREPRDAMEGIASKVTPDYPDAASSEHARGSVEVTVSVDPDGSVFGVDLTSSSGFALLDEAVVQAALSSKYEPAVLVTSMGDERVPNRFHAFYLFSGAQ